MVRKGSEAFCVWGKSIKALRTTILGTTKGVNFGRKHSGAQGLWDLFSPVFTTVDAITENPCDPINTISQKDPDKNRRLPC